MASIDDVAAYVVEHFHSSISTMKLQKLCYMTQGWSMALRGADLFDDDFEAWRHGPVSRHLYNHHRGQFSVGEWGPGDSSDLSRAERIVCDAVLQNYGALTGLELSELTHRPGTPWSKTRAAVHAAEGDWSGAIISKGLMRTYFRDTLLPSRGA